MIHTKSASQMSVRAANVSSYRSNRLRDILAAAEHHRTATSMATMTDDIEYDVLDSAGVRFGSAIAHGDGAVFVTPSELYGVLVRLPFRVTQQPNSQRLATTLAEVLSSALGR